MFLCLGGEQDPVTAVSQVEDRTVNDTAFKVPVTVVSISVQSAVFVVMRSVVLLQHGGRF